MTKTDYIFEKTEECVQHAASELEMTECDGGLCEASQAHVVQSQELMDKPDHEKHQSDGFEYYEEILIKSLNKGLNKSWEFFFGGPIPESKEKLTKLSEESDEVNLSEESGEVKLSEESDEAKLSEESDEATQNLRLAEEEVKDGSYFDVNFATSTGSTDVTLIGAYPVPIPPLRVDAPFLSVPDLYSNGNNAHSAPWGTTNSISTSFCSTPSLGSSPTPSLSDPEDYATTDITAAAVANTLPDAAQAKFRPPSLKKPSPFKIMNIATNTNVPELETAKYLDKMGRHHEAWKIFKQLAHEGIPEAKFYTGYYLTHHHHVVNMNVKKGYMLFREAAELNQPDAQYWFGRAINEGKVQAFLPIEFGGVPMKDGLEYLKKAAEQNHLLSIKYLEKERKKDRMEGHHLSGHCKESDFTGMEKLAHVQPFCDPGVPLIREQARNNHFRNRSNS